MTGRAAPSPDGGSRHRLALPRDDASAEFFAAARRGRLLLRRCTAQGHWNPPAAMVCERCGDPWGEWHEASGRGVVEAAAVVHRRDRDGVSYRYTVAIVTLAEGPWLRGQLPYTGESCPPAGTAVRVDFSPVERGEPLPVFVVEP